MRSVKPDGRQLRFGADKIRLPAAGPGLLYLPNEEARKPWGTKTCAPFCVKTDEQISEPFQASFFPLC